MDKAPTCLAIGTTLLAALVLLAAGGCGTGGDGTDDGAATDSVYLPPRLEGPGRSGEDVLAAEVIRDVQEGMVMGSGRSVCYELSHRAEERVMRTGGGPLRSCPEVVEEAIDGWRAAGEAPLLAEIQHVEVDGRRAVVTVGDGHGGSYRVRVIKRLQWELPALALDRPPGFALLE